MSPMAVLLSEPLVSRFTRLGRPQPAADCSFLIMVESCAWTRLQFSYQTANGNLSAIRSDSDTYLGTVWGFFFVQFFWKRPKSALGSALSRARSRPCQNSLKPSAGWKMDVATVMSPVDLSSPARAERFPVTILVFWTRGGNRHSLARQSQAVGQRAGFRRPSFLTHRITQIY